MPYNQITAAGTIAPGPDPVGPTGKEIRDLIETTLNSDGFTFSWSARRHQPYEGTLDTGASIINLYIYAWRIGNGGRANLPSEKRIQIQQGVNNVGFLRSITPTNKTLLLGVYDSPSGTPIFAAWDAAANAAHTQKSCQVQVEDLQAAITENIHQCTDSRGNIIYTFMPDSLGDYIDLVSAGNAFVFPAGTTGTLVAKVKTATLPTRKKRAIKSTQKVLQQIQNLSSTEKEVITKQRVGQGLFKDLLINKYHGKCALCGIQTEQMLIGSHIKSWKDSSDAEKLDENNGLLLCAHHDALFDKHLISFKDNGDLIVSTTLSASERAELQIAAIPPITVTPGMKSYLADHRSKLK